MSIIMMLLLSQLVLGLQLVTLGELRFTLSVESDLR